VDKGVLVLLRKRAGVYYQVFKKTRGITKEKENNKKDKL